ncbi:MAG TPA: hypothetical protein VG496_11905 [Myxococcales bacterium]|nr:hypothetical protein [Myxococcales bacterium]
MIRVLFVAGLWIAITASAASPDKASDSQTKALVEGQFPDDPARVLVLSKCLLCHSGEYVTQQRLTEGQWQKTVDKMRKFGTPASDEEAKAIVAYLSHYWTPDLAPPRFVRTPPPPGSVAHK